MANALSQLSIHTITNKPWDGATCIREYAKAGVGGITFWRYNFETTSAAELGRQARDAGLTVTGLARGGFFPAIDPLARQKALDENRQAIQEAHDCGSPCLVLVCGAVPGMPLSEARLQITEGIAALLEEANAAGVILAIEPLHPMYADDRSAIITLGQANDVCDALGSPKGLGIAMDVFHTWWDSQLQQEIMRAGANGRLTAYHVCDWKTPTLDLLNDRGLMGEGCIPLVEIKEWMTRAGFNGFSEVEVFSNRWWSTDQHDYLARIVQSYRAHC